MAIYITTNTASLFAQRMLSNYQKDLDTSMRRLASGLRINSARDDPAGLQISNRLTSEIEGLTQGNRNAMDGMSFAAVAEGAMDEMTNMYQRIRTLALQSANGTNSSADRTALQQEVTSLCSEITRINDQTTFGGDGALLNKGSVSFQVGADSGQTISVNTKGKIGDTDLTNWHVGTLAAAIAADGGEAVANYTSGDNFDISTQDKAQKVLANIDKFIAAVDSKRAEFGATQNRLESTIRNQSNVSENVSAARSRIRDTDFASETAAMTQQNIIQQASQSILSQANQRPQVALSLLG